MKLLISFRGLPLSFLVVALMLLACVPGYAQRGAAAGQRLQEVGEVAERRLRVKMRRSI